LAVKLETSAPGWWFLQAPTEDPCDSVFIGTRAAGDDTDYAELDPHAAPLDEFVLYRQRNAGAAIHSTETAVVVSGDSAELAAAVRGLLRLERDELAQIA
jgi:hypothetical protein